MNETYKSLMLRLIQEKPGGFFYYNGGFRGGWEVFRMGGMSDWVYEFDMPKTSFAIYPKHLDGIDHCRMEFKPQSSAEADRLLRDLREIDIYAVSVFDPLLHSTAWLALFSETDAVVAQGLKHV